MEQAKQKFEFVVLKKSYTYQDCTNCNGSGKLTRLYRKMEFVHDCPICRGEGRQRFAITEEVPLVEALIEIGCGVVSVDLLKTKSI